MKRTVDRHWWGYLPELVRDIHLNPVPAALAEDLNELARCAYSGHSVLMGRIKKAWQDTQKVLGISIPSVSESATCGRWIADAKGCHL